MCYFLKQWCREWREKSQNLQLQRCFSSFCVSSDVNSKSARVLVLLVVPGHLLFLYTIHLLQGGHTALTLTFITCYLSAALLQVRLTADENFDVYLWCSHTVTRSFKYLWINIWHLSESQWYVVHSSQHKKRSMMFLTCTWRQHEMGLCFMKWNPIMRLCPGGHLALRGQRDGAVAVAEGPGPGQLLHPLPHSSGGPAGDRLPGSELQTHSDCQLSWDSGLTAVALIGCLPLMQVAEMLHNTKLIRGGWMMKMEIKPDREIRILKAHTFYFKCGDKLSCNWFFCVLAHTIQKGDWNIHLGKCCRE